MLGENLRFIRDFAGMSRDNLAILLEISQRQLTEMEKSETRVEKPYALAVKVIFEIGLLKKILQKIVLDAYEIVKAEYIAFWIVCGEEIVLIPDVTYHDKNADNYRFYNDEIRKMKSEQSLIAYPVQANKSLNLNKKEIAEHEEKRIKDPKFNSHYFMDGFGAKNLLHIPYQSKFIDGYKPVLLLALENKLNTTEEDKFSNEDLERLEKLLKESFEDKDISMGDTSVKVAETEKCASEKKKVLKDLYEAFDFHSQIYPPDFKKGML